MAKRDKTVALPQHELECLRKCLKTAMDIISRNGLDGEISTSPQKARKPISFKKGVENYKKLLSSGAQRQWPAHLEEQLKK